MANLDKDAVIAAFTKAYEKANGKAPSIESKSGWYSVDGGKNMRLAQLQEMTEALASHSSEGTEMKKRKAKLNPRPNQPRRKRLLLKNRVSRLRIFGQKS